jgi:hypothetical protein
MTSWIDAPRRLRVNWRPHVGERRISPDSLAVSLICDGIEIQILYRGGSMPELRGIQATEEVKEEWKYAYSLYLQAPGDRYDKKNDRTERIGYVAKAMQLTRKQAKRRIRNYEAWQRNIKKGLVT